jgi:hypothetical protein
LQIGVDVDVLLRLFVVLRPCWGCTIEDLAALVVESVKNAGVEEEPAGNR